MTNGSHVVIILAGNHGLVFNLCEAAIKHQFLLIAISVNNASVIFSNVIPPRTNPRVFGEGKKWANTPRWGNRAVQIPGYSKNGTIYASGILQ